MTFVEHIAALVTSRGWNPRVIRPGSRLHEFLFRTLDLGRSRLIGQDTLILTTCGRKTGTETSTPLFCAEDAARLYVAGSFDGSGTPPNWYVDLTAHPEVNAGYPLKPCSRRPILSRYVKFSANTAYRPAEGAPADQVARTRIAASVVKRLLAGAGPGSTPRGFLGGHPAAASLETVMAGKGCTAPLLREVERCYWSLWLRLRVAAQDLSAGGPLRPVPPLRRGRSPNRRSARFGCEGARGRIGGLFRASGVMSSEIVRADADRNDATSTGLPRTVAEGSHVSESPSSLPRPRVARSSPTCSKSKGSSAFRRRMRALVCSRTGPNELPAQQKRNLLTIVLEVVREPMFLMLVAAGVVYLLLGEPADALMLLGFVFVVMAITIVQARRTEHALEALRDLSSPRALVIRDGQRRRIAGREVVAGDLVVLAEGDRVPADGLLRQALHLATDESLLTGESVPVRKVPSADARALDRPGGDDLPSVFSGTLVTSGQGIVEIAATGPRTELGKIGKALEQTQGRADDAADRDPAHRPHSRHHRTRGLLRRGGGLCAHPRWWCRRVEARVPRRHRDGDGHSARGVPGRAHHLPRAGRVAIVAQPGAHAADAGDRDAGGRHRAVRRQDRHPHAEPDDAAQARHRR